MQFHRTYKILFILFASALTTVWDYQFGLYDHVEHIPLYLRLKDPSYLSQDFFLESMSTGFGHRMYFSYFILLCNLLLPLPLIYFILTFFTNVIISWATYKIIKFIFKLDWPALTSVLAVMSIHVVSAGSTTEIHAPYLTPNSVAFALVLVSIYYILKEKYIKSAWILGITALIHPLVGPESGVILFTSVFVYSLISKGTEWSKHRYLISPLIIFGCFTIVSIIPFFLNSSDALDDKLFIAIYGHFRNPHHILPSYFLKDADIQHIVYLIILAIELFLLWYFLFKEQIRTIIIFTGIFTSIVLLCYLGFYYVEIIPSRLMMIAQSFRLLYILKWFLLSFSVGFWAFLYHRNLNTDQRYSWVGLFTAFHLPSTVYLLSLWIICTQIRNEYTTGKKMLRIEKFLLYIIFFHAVYQIFQTTIQMADAYIWLMLLIALPIGIWFELKPKTQYAIWAALLLSVSSYWISHSRSESDIISLFINIEPNDWDKRLAALMKAASRQYDYADFPKEVYDLSQEIKKQTPKDAILLVPPALGELRYLADRALVVDFKTYPMNGKYLLEWQKRIYDCYTWTEEVSFEAVDWVFIPNYKIINKWKLASLSRKYKATYAVLYKNTACSYPILYENKKYKLALIGMF